MVHTEPDAIRALEDSLPVAMVLDLNLESGSGWNVLAHLKRLPGHDSTKVYVYTASDLGEGDQRKLHEDLVTIVHKHGENSLTGLVNSIVKNASS